MGTVMMPVWNVMITIELDLQLGFGASGGKEI